MSDTAGAQLPKLIAILGPTAAGKTSLGIKVAQQLNGAIVSADSRQLYTYLNIGTAKPEELWHNDTHSITTPEIIDNIPHYLFNISAIDKLLTLADWQPAAFAAIDRIIEQGKVPLLVGGTMLYLDSVIKNYSLPQVPPNPSLRAKLKKITAEELYQEVIRQDPPAAKFIEPHHQQRLIRALEVMVATHKPFSSQRIKRPSRYQVTIYGLFPNWDTLTQRLTARVEQMWNDGLLDETKRHQQKYGRDTPLLKTINYRQAAAVLAGELTPKQAQEEMIRANLRYARRQMSWWRGRKNIIWSEKADPKPILEKIK